MYRHGSPRVRTSLKERPPGFRCPVQKKRGAGAHSARCARSPSASRTSIVLPAGYRARSRRRLSPGPISAEAGFASWYTARWEGHVRSSQLVRVRTIAPPGSRTSRYVEAGRAPAGAAITSTDQFVPVSRTFTDICRGGLFVTTKPATMTYSTAASTTVIATIRMVPITGDTAFPSSRWVRLMLAPLAAIRGGVGTGGRRDTGAGIVRERENLGTARRGSLGPSTTRGCPCP